MGIALSQIFADYLVPEPVLYPIKRVNLTQLGYKNLL